MGIDFGCLVFIAKQACRQQADNTGGRGLDVRVVVDYDRGVATEFDGEVLDGEVVLPVVGKRLVKGAVLLRGRPQACASRWAFAC